MNRFTRRDVLGGLAATLAGRRMGWAAQGPAANNGATGDDDSLARRREYLEILRRLAPAAHPQRMLSRRNPVDKHWDDWVDRTGELPPDFETMPSSGLLPDPLLMVEGGRKIRIRTAAQWKRQRVWIRGQLERWVYGTMPPAPGNTRGIVTASHQEGDTRVEDVRVEFGPDYRATLRVQLLIPPGKGPFPAFLTNHPRMRPWVNTAVRRGYIGCIVYALDPGYGNPDDTDPWLEMYPDYDWACIVRWAWGAMRAVDYLVTLPLVERTKICIAGHSRNSKSAVAAAAFDERIGAVVPSRGNAGDYLPWRFTSPMYLQESIEEITSSCWFHPRLRFFVGRENKLPVDQNELLSLIAPRGLMISHAFMEHQGNPLGVEQSYRSARSVYRLLGREENLWLYQQPGEHPASAEDVEQYFDFFDTVFARKQYPKQQRWVHGYSFEGWLGYSKEKINPLSYRRRELGDFWPVGTAQEWEEKRNKIQERIRWALGEEPPGMPYLPERRSVAERSMTSEGWRGQLYRKPVQGMRARGFAFGDDLRGELYLPEGAFQNGRMRLDVKWPVVIWLHPYSYATGYARWALWASLVRRGFMVMTFDQIGFGTRNEYTLRFYERYRRWSLMGKMVTDTRAAVSALHPLNIVDSTRIYLFGWTLGAKVALLTAALDERVAGVSMVSGFAPLRLDRPEKGTEGVRHYSHIHGLLPRLGFFAGQEERLPVDFDEVLAAVAPRPAFALAPTLDWLHPVDDVRQAVEAAGKVYGLLGSPEALQLETPLEFNRFEQSVQRQAYGWLGARAGLPELPPPQPRR